MGGGEEAGDTKGHPLYISTCISLSNPFIATHLVSLSKNNRPRLNGIILRKHLHVILTEKYRKKLGLMHLAHDSHTHTDTDTEPRTYSHTHTHTVHHSHTRTRTCSLTVISTFTLTHTDTRTHSRTAHHSYTHTRTCTCSHTAISIFTLTHTSTFTSVLSFQSSSTDSFY